MSGHSDSNEATPKDECDRLQASESNERETAVAVPCAPYSAQDGRQQALQWHAPNVYPNARVPLLPGAKQEPAEASSSLPRAFGVANLPLLPGAKQEPAESSSSLPRALGVPNGNACAIAQVGTLLPVTSTWPTVLGPFAPSYYYSPVFCKPNAPPAFALATSYLCNVQATIGATAAFHTAEALQLPPMKPAVQMQAMPARTSAPESRSICADEHSTSNEPPVELWERGFRDVLDTWSVVGTLCRRFSVE